MVHRHISQTTTATTTHPMVQTPPIPPIINNIPSQAKDALRRQGYRTSHQPTYNSVERISAVSTNGHSYNGSIFDINGTRLA